MLWSENLDGEVRVSADVPVQVWTNGALHRLGGKAGDDDDDDQDDLGQNDENLITNKMMIRQMLDWGASDFGTDLGRCHFIGAVQNEEESIKVERLSWWSYMRIILIIWESFVIWESCVMMTYPTILMKVMILTQMTLAAAPGSIPGKNHGLRLIMDAEVKTFFWTQSRPGQVKIFNVAPGNLPNLTRIQNFGILHRLMYTVCIVFYGIFWTSYIMKRQ